MASQTIKTVIQLRRATTAEWKQYDYIVPAKGEPCFDIELNTLKIGDGVKSYAELKPIGGGSTVAVSADGNSLILEGSVFKLAGFDTAEVNAQPRVGKDGKLEWFIPSVDISDLESRVKALEGADIDGKIDEKINAFTTKLSDDQTVNTFKELVDYVADHGPEAADMAAQITKLEGLVGENPVSDQISTAIANSGHISKTEAKARFEHVKYEITNAPVGTLVNYGEKEIRVMCPENTEWVKQNVGPGGNTNRYYLTFRAYAPEGAVSFKEDAKTVIEDDTMWYFENNSSAGIDAYGRKYSVIWWSVAEYDEATDTWTYFGAESKDGNYVGKDYSVEWYDENEVMIASDYVRINYTNKNCHNTVKPYYMQDVVSATDTMIMDGGGAAG